MNYAFIKSSIGSIFAQGGGIVANFLVAALLARLLGVDGYGVYSFALAGVMLLAVPTQLGLPQLMVRETSRAFALNRWDVMKGLWVWVRRCLSGVFLAFILVFLAALLLKARFEFTPRLLTLSIGIILVPFLTTLMVFSGILRGLGNTFLSLVSYMVFRPSLLIIFLICLLIFDLELTPEIAMGLNVIATVLCSIFVWWFLLWKTPAEIKVNKPNFSNAPDWRKAIIPLALINGCYTINSQVDVLILGVYVSDSDVGLYRAASQLAGLTIFGLSAVNLVLHPQIARLFSQGKIDELQKIITFSTRIIFILALIPVAVFISSGSALLVLVFGSAFSGATLVLSILSVGQMGNAFFGSAESLLMMTGNEKRTLKALGCAIFTNVLLNIVLIPIWGITGAAVATGSSFTIWSLALWVLSRKVLGIETTLFGARSTSDKRR